jgi:uncharacterized protein YecT (DUF1311 family)
MAGPSWLMSDLRAVLPALVAILIGFAHPSLAQDSPDSDRSISEKLPLFARNHCVDLRDSAEQLFCGDPALNDALTRQQAAIEERLNRLPDRSLAIEENAQWIRARNSSCGILGRDAIRFQDLDAIKACLLKETDERTAILRDPSYDCLAANTVAGALICSDPALAIAEAELNDRVLALIARLKDDEAKDAIAEYARWTRERDRKCNLAGKDNVPLQELSSSEPCLADDINRKAAELAAAKDDPKRVFGRRAGSPLPNADAVDLCVARIHAANGCGEFLRVNRVFEIDTEIAEQAALITAEVEMIVVSPFAVCSPVASSCTGACWDPKSGKPRPSQASRDSFAVAHRIKIEKVFAFGRSDGSDWRCNTQALQPVDFGVAQSGP